VVSLGHVHAATARADATEAVAHIRESAALPMQTLGQAAGDERARIDAAARASGRQIGVAATNVENMTEAMAAAAIAAVDINSNAEERAVRESVRAAQAVVGPHCDRFVLDAGGRVNRAAYQLAGSIDGAVHEAQRQIDVGLGSLVGTLTAAGDAMAARIEAQTLAVVAALATAEQRTAIQFAEARHAMTTPGAAGPSLAEIDLALSHTADALTGIGPSVTAMLETLCAGARSQYQAVTAQVARVAWPAVAETRTRWKAQTDGFIASVEVLTQEAIGKLTSVESLLPARFAEVAAEAVAAERRTYFETSMHMIGGAVASVLRGIGELLVATLVLAAIIVVALETPIIATGLLALAIMGVVSLADHAVKSFTARVDALSDQWGDWPLWGKLTSIGLALLAAPDDAVGLTPGVEAGMQRDSVTGAHLTGSQSVERAAQFGVNLVTTALIGKALHGAGEGAGAGAEVVERSQPEAPIKVPPVRETPPEAKASKAAPDERSHAGGIGPPASVEAPTSSTGPLPHVERTGELGDPSGSSRAGTNADEAHQRAAPHSGGDGTNLEGPLVQRPSSAGPASEVEVGKGRENGPPRLERSGQAVRPRGWDKFDPLYDLAFRERLKEFRGSDDTTPDPGLRGGEGQLFRGKNPARALKRWFAKRVGDMGHSISLLLDAKGAVDGNAVLAEHVAVVEIGEQGGDWAIRDFDSKSVELKAAGDGAPAAARRAAIAELERLRVDGGLTPVLADLLKKLAKEPPSANLHWSPGKNKILVIDMQ
jgi:hypothetical protein